MTKSGKDTLQHAFNKSLW